jgi:hypothetical protein
MDDNLHKHQASAAGIALTFSQGFLWHGMRRIIDPDPRVVVRGLRLRINQSRGGEKNPTHEYYGEEH